VLGGGRGAVAMHTRRAAGPYAASGLSPSMAASAQRKAPPVSRRGRFLALLLLFPRLPGVTAPLSNVTGSTKTISSSQMKNLNPRNRGAIVTISLGTVNRWKLLGTTVPVRTAKLTLLTLKREVKFLLTTTLWIRVRWLSLSDTRP